MQQQLVLGRATATTVTHTQVAAISEALYASADLTVANAETTSDSRLEREADFGLSAQVLADNVGQPELLRRRLWIGVDLSETREDETSELVSAVVLRPICLR